MARSKGSRKNRYRTENIPVDVTGIESRNFEDNFAYSHKTARDRDITSPGYAGPLHERRPPLDYKYDEQPRVRVRKRKNTKWFQDPHVWQQINDAMAGKIGRVTLRQRKRTRCENRNAARRAAAFRSGRTGAPIKRNYRC